MKTRPSRAKRPTTRAARDAGVPETDSLDQGEDAALAPALARGLRVLELLADHPAGLNLVEIAARLGLPVNSTQRLGLTLCSLGYARRDPLSKRFLLTSKLLAVGGRGLGERGLVERAWDVMRELRDQVGETVLLGVLQGNEVICLEQVPARHPFKFMVDPGLRAPLYSNAPGKALWAFLPKAEREALLAQAPFAPRTSHTLVSRADLAHELAQVRQRGFATDREEDLEGCHCVAAPVFDHRGRPMAALWISGPAGRLPVSLFATLGPQVQAHAARLSQSRE